jgi:MFS family permease
MTIVWVLYAVIQYPGGRIADAHSRKMTMLAALAVAGLGYGVVSWAGTYALFLGGLILVGIGSALYPPAAYATTVELPGDSDGARFGILGASINFGGVAAAGLTTLFLAVAIWRTTLVALVGIVVVLGVLKARFVTSANLDSSADSRGNVLSRVLGDPQLRVLLLSITLFTFAWQSVATTLPTFLRLGRDLPSMYATAAFGLLYGAGILLSPIAGAIGGHVGYSRVGVTLITVGGGGLGVLVVGHDPVVVGLGVVLLAIGFPPFLTVMEAYLIQLFAAESVSGDFGAGRALYIGLGSLGPAYLGYVTDLANYAVAYATLVVVLATSGVLLVVQSRRRGFRR